MQTLLWPYMLGEEGHIKEHRLVVLSAKKGVMQAN
jgi:hypothetical protein